MMWGWFLHFSEWCLWCNMNASFSCGCCLLSSLSLCHYLAWLSETSQSWPKGPSVFHSLAMHFSFSFWGKHGIHSSDLCGRKLTVMLWLAKAAWSTSEPCVCFAGSSALASLIGQSCMEHLGTLCLFCWIISIGLADFPSLQAFYILNFETDLSCGVYD